MKVVGPATARWQALLGRIRKPPQKQDAAGAGVADGEDKGMIGAEDGGGRGGFARAGAATSTAVAAAASVPSSFTSLHYQIMITAGSVAGPTEIQRATMDWRKIMITRKRA